MKNETFMQVASKREIKRDDYAVHAYLKTLELGETDPDRQIFVDLAQGKIGREDDKMKDYYIPFTTVVDLHEELVKEIFASRPTAQVAQLIFSAS